VNVPERALETHESRRYEWVISASPHIRAEESTARIMWSVVACLAPAAAWGVYVFGAGALYVIFMCVATCVATEYACNRIRGRAPTIGDGSAVVTGLLLAFVLPSHSVIVRTLADGATVSELVPLDWKVPVVGGVFAIAVVKHCFGGLGHNVWNPALAGRAFVQLSFLKHLSPAAWPWPMGAPDAVTSATSLSKASDAMFSVRDLFFGYCPGCIGEVSAFLLLVGVIYLIAKRYVDWRLPLAYMVTLVALATLFGLLAGGGQPAWVRLFADRFTAFRAGSIGGGELGRHWLTFAGRELFSGGLMLGALYMATDMVTSPLSSRGQLYFGVGCGLLTALIRAFSGMPEGVCYAILLMNTVRPYVDRVSRPRVLGERKGENP